MDVNDGRHDRTLLTGVIESDTDLLLRETPVLGRYDDGLRTRVASPRELGSPGVERGGRVATRRYSGAQRKARDARAVGNKLGSYKAGDSLPVDPCDRHVEEHAPTTWEEIRLPGHPNDRISPSHQEPIAGMAPGQGVVRVRCIVEELKRALVAAVAIVEEQPAIGAPEIDRLQDHEIGRTADEPVLVARSELEICNAASGHGSRVHANVDFSDESLISAARPKAIACCKLPAIFNRERDPSASHLLPPAPALSALEAR